MSATWTQAVLAGWAVIILALAVLLIGVLA